MDGRYTKCTYTCNGTKSPISFSHKEKRFNRTYFPAFFVARRPARVRPWSHAVGEVHGSRDKVVYRRKEREQTNTRQAADIKDKLMPIFLELML